MRADSVGIFWQDQPAAKRGQIIRQQPPIPETGWRPPKYFPNLSAAKRLAVDLETWDPEIEEHGPGWARGKGHIAGISIATDDGYRGYFPMRHTIEPEMNMNPEHVTAWADDTLGNFYGELSGANLIYDMGWLRQEKIRIVTNNLVDIQYGESLLEERAKVGLETISQKYLKIGKAGEFVYKWCSDYYGGKATHDAQAKNLYRAPPRLVGPYGEGDADRPIRIAPFVLQRLQDENLLDLFRMECALIPLLIEMRFAGVTVDLSKAEQVRDSLILRAEAEQKKLDDVVGFHVNTGSSAELAKAFDSLGLKYPRKPPTQKSPDGNPSFVKDWLATVQHPVAKHILEVRRFSKLGGTFIEGYILNGHINGKIHGSFNPLRMDDGGAVSGRFSSDCPNLQNLPIRDKELGKLIRSMFIPDFGHVRWRKFDYSQIEYRFLVHFAVGRGSEEARAKYCSDPKTDFHVWVQQLVEAVWGQVVERRLIKNINFGMSFGMGKDKLIRYMNIAVKIAEEFIKKYHEGLPFSKPTMDYYMEEANRTGIIYTILGRKARFDLWEPAKWGTDAVALPYELALRKYGNIRRAYLHKALNRKLQGSAADLIKAAMVKCWKDGIFNATGVPRLTVHDELDHSDPGTKEAEEGFKEEKRIMENVIKLSIPIIAEESIGDNWGSAEKAA